MACGKGPVGAEPWQAPFLHVTSSCSCSGQSAPHQQVMIITKKAVLWKQQSSKGRKGWDTRDAPSHGFVLNVQSVVPEGRAPSLLANLQPDVAIESCT